MAGFYILSRSSKAWGNKSSDLAIYAAYSAVEIKGKHNPSSLYACYLRVRTGRQVQLIKTSRPDVMFRVATFLQPFYPRTLNHDQFLMYDGRRFHLSFYKERERSPKYKDLLAWLSWLRCGWEFVMDTDPPDPIEVIKLGLARAVEIHNPVPYLYSRSITREDILVLLRALRAGAYSSSGCSIHGTSRRILNDYRNYI